MSPVPERRKRQAAGPRLSHVDARGRAAMVDVGHKAATAREAWAQGTITMSPAALRAVRTGTVAKGDVLQVARLAGILAAKQTASLIPLCHPLPLTDLVVAVTPDRAAGLLRIRAEAATTGPTGVEMEALTAASVAALTAYDMVKSAERGVEIRSVHLVSKSGGRSGDWHRPADAPGSGGPAGTGGMALARPRRPGERVAGRIRKKS